MGVGRVIYIREKASVRVCARALYGRREVSVGLCGLEMGGHSPHSRETLCSFSRGTSII